MFQLKSLVLLVLCLISVSSPRAEILIGVPAPVTGPYAWNGEQVEQGTALAIEAVNAQGGVLGRSLRALVVDDFCDGRQAVAAAHKLLDAAVHVVIGHQCSGAMIPASEVYEAAGMIVISPAATNPQVTERGLRFTFRTSGRDDHQGQIAGDYLADNWNGDAIAVIHDDQAYGRGIAAEVVRRLSVRDQSPVIDQEIKSGDKDFADLISRLEAANVEVIFYGGYQHEAGLIVRQTHERMPRAKFLLSDAVAGDEFPLIAGEAAEGIRMTSLWDARNRVEAAPIVKHFRDRGYEPNSSTLYAYAAVEAWTQAVRSAGTLESEAVAATLRSHQFDTVLGRLSFDAKGDVAGITTFEWFEWHDGTYAPLEESDQEKQK